MDIHCLSWTLATSHTLRKKRGAKTAPRRVHFLVRRTDPFVAPKHDYEEKNDPSLPKRNRFPKRLLWGTVLAPLFFWVYSLARECWCVVALKKPTRKFGRNNKTGLHWRTYCRQLASVTFDTVIRLYSGGRISSFDIFHMNDYFLNSAIALLQTCHLKHFYHSSVD